MIGGCFKNFFALIGCLVLLIIAIALTWLFWPQIKEIYEDRFAGHRSVHVFTVATADSDVLIRRVG